MTYDHWKLASPEEGVDLGGWNDDEHTAVDECVHGEAIGTNLHELDRVGISRHQASQCEADTESSRARRLLVTECRLGSRGLCGRRRRVTADQPG